MLDLLEIKQTKFFTAGFGKYIYIKKIEMTELAIPYVSVCMITFNHEKFIGQAIESVLAQSVNFAYEIVIGEDCSTDKTLTICEKYFHQYPNRISLLHQKENMGMMKNFIFTLNACKGKYVALLEGDDYWTDPYKLQKQVDFMESHPECSLTFHAAEIKDVTKDQKNRIKRNADINRYFAIDDLTLGGGGFISTPTILLKSSVVKNLPDWYCYVPAGDYPLVLLAAIQGTAYYMNEVMAVYRTGVSGSLMTKRSKFTIQDWVDYRGKTIKMLVAINKENNSKSYSSIIKTINKLIKNTAELINKFACREKLLFVDENKSLLSFMGRVLFAFTGVFNKKSQCIFSRFLIEEILKKKAEEIINAKNH